MKALRKLRRIINELSYLRTTYAPAPVVRGYVHGRLVNKSKTRPFFAQRDAFKQHAAQSLKLSNDWFTNNAAQWLSVIDEYRLRDKPIRVLEIGSWQGLSSYFTLHQMSHATISCVDTWEGADEHKSGDAVSKDILSAAETTFDHNLATYASRLTKFKGTSYLYFAQNPVDTMFDLIYVDGSHHSDDVVTDAVQCFQRLRIGGLMIFDDYFWRYYSNPLENPAAAVNVFLRLKKDQYKVVRVYHQLIIEKTADGSARH